MKPQAVRRQSATMTGILGLAGLTHFFRPKTFDSIVPPRLGDPRFITYASGVAELGCATLLALPPTRRLGGMAAAVLMVAIYPANIYTVKKHWHNPRGRAIALARLPLQVPLVWMSWNIAKDRTKVSR
ncbi:hypothetical protein CIK59_10500 [Brevibacterium aurantiacum]|uniref:DoxX family membrane protein n=2 Tax=Brevibacterium aurantiacum TaxID=273384 RepID=A0A2A3ZQS9_BREAU|nr:hypothetical protein CIK59_10500 [Brevibacterium aurantiacum]